MFSIISVNYNNHKFTAECVALTCKILTDLEIVYEYILIDNCSTDDSFEVLRSIFEYDKTVIVVKTEKNGGFGYGNNIGASLAKYEILWFLNSDAWCTSFNNLGAMIKLIKTNNTGIVSNIMLDKDGTVHPNGGAELSFRYFFISSFRIGLLVRRFTFLKKIVYVLLLKSNYVKALQHNRMTEPVSVQIVSGASFFIDRNKYLKLNGFDESFFLYDEDTDLCYRSLMMGWHNYVTNFAEVMTVNHSSTSKLNHDYLKRIKLNSRLYLYQKHFKGMKRVLLSWIAKFTWKLL